MGLLDQTLLFFKFNSSGWFGGHGHPINASRDRSLHAWSGRAVITHLYELEPLRWRGDSTECAIERCKDLGYLAWRSVTGTYLCEGSHDDPHHVA